MQRIDPLMLAGLAALDMEADAGAATEAAAGLDAPVATAPVEGAAWSADADPELLESFVAESVEYLESAESALLVLEADTTNGEAVNTVFRCFHTIKGTSAFLGLTRVSELAHGAESLMSAVREQAIRLEGRHADLAFRSVDVLGELVRGVGRRASAASCVHWPIRPPRPTRARPPRRCRACRSRRCARPMAQPGRRRRCGCASARIGWTGSWTPLASWSSRTR
jgi:HPt (histidine-containing phosphotransfer) domain-containing protein